MAVQITTNHQWHNFVCREDVPIKVLCRDFQWCGEQDYFFCYRRRWYHLSEFEYREKIPYFDAIHLDSFYSGVVIAVSNDCEQYKVGTLIS